MIGNIIQAGGYMEIFNFGVGSESTEKQTFRVIKERIGMSEEEFFQLPSKEISEWVDACRLAILLEETNHDKLYAGYKDTEMYSASGVYNLAAATEIVRKKKRALDVIERSTEIDLTPAQFILMGDNETVVFLNEAMKKVNLETAKALNNK